METCTPKQKAEMYAAASDKLSDVVVALRGFVEATDDPEAEEVVQARTTADRMTTQIGSFKVREKQATLETE